MRTNYPSTDLVGYKYGKLTVIERSSLVSKRKDNNTACSWWLCRCECGADVTRSRIQISNKNKDRCDICKQEQKESKMQSDENDYKDLYEKECERADRNYDLFEQKCDEVLVLRERLAAIRLALSDE